MEAYEIAVIGGGMLGSAIGWGCATRGARVAVLDGGDTALRAARGNFGLVWSQGKGDGMPAYAAWTRASLAAWPALADRISALLGRDCGLRQEGGLNFCLGEAEFEARRAVVNRLHNQGAASLRLLDRKELLELMPGCRLGDAVVGASYEPRDGHTDPLSLLQGFHAGLHALGAAHLPGAEVVRIEPGRPYVIHRADGSRVAAEKIVIACGLGTPRVAAMLGAHIPLRPVRGQNIVTERLPPMLPLPASAIRQTVHGTVQIGVTQEDDGDPTPFTTTAHLAGMAARAIQVLPDLARARAFRAWGALRPMTPDGFPAYAEIEGHPGAFVAVCHSAVTLAAMHAGPLAEGILAGRLPEAVTELHPSRFHVPAH
ncbi:NAD(P)/FAD-dependent oxidoreductase [Rhodovarius lipocyclicus]|uniref:NAD(P)/FAD-dependent oxidoreductase n=1 Tax=Rhodovarius lipocyclicus TaxID=268410 RepID=UPI00135949A5|nr:FAD-binding oxidoreductase [Rhodovarius lipocyclicus]